MTFPMGYSKEDEKQILAGLTKSGWEYKVIRMATLNSESKITGEVIGNLWDRVNTTLEDLHSEGWLTPGAVSSTESEAVYIVCERLKK